MKSRKKKIEQINFIFEIFKKRKELYQDTKNLRMEYIERNKLHGLFEFLKIMVILGVFIFIRYKNIDIVQLTAKSPLILTIVGVYSVIGFGFVFLEVISYRLLRKAYRLRKARRFKIPKIPKAVPIPSNTVAEMILTKKNQKYKLCYIISCLWVFICLMVSAVFSINISNIYLVAPIILTTMLLLNSVVISIRIKKGYWGNNAYEAREAVNFIISNIAKSRSDFIDSDGKRIKPFDWVEVQEEIKSTLKLGEEGSRI